MKELKFFYDEIESGGISKRVEKYSGKVVEIENDPRYGSGFPYIDLMYDDDFTKYSYSLYIPGAPKLYESQSEFSPISYDLQNDLHKEFEIWFDVSYNNGLFELPEELRKEFVKRVKKYIVLVDENDLLKKILNPALELFIRKIIDLYPIQYKESDFKISEKKKHKTTYLPTNAISDLKRVYNFEKQTVTNDINEEGWAFYFIGEVHLNEGVKLKISNELFSLMLDALAKKHLNHGYYGHFYKTIESDKRIITIDGTPLSETNIKKCVSSVYNSKDKSKSQLLDRVNQCIPE